MIVSTALLCMAITVYHEARGELIPGQYAVAHVLFNRAAADPNRVCTEAFKPKQFSWANKGVTRVKAGWSINARLLPKDDYAWWKAQIIARQVLAAAIPDLNKGATHYHTVDVKPYWRTSYKVVRQQGRHVFYRPLLSQG